ncbi:MAG: polysaccharide biosynthesis/export family protein [Chitinophagaceae bacterium]|nr:polysaccharide biosynthesis/export family protein [Chitinophagaceae bacterium]
MKKIVLFGFIIGLFFTSCTNYKKLEKQYQLFQTGLDSMSKYSYKSLTLKPYDVIIIKTYTTATSNQDQTSLFNILGNKFTINQNGTIDLPKIGILKVEGLTCKQLKTVLINEWSTYVKDILVDVQFAGLTVNVLGEVASQGTKKFEKEEVTIIDVLAASGGLNLDAKRNDILVIREDSGRRQHYLLDLRDANFYTSPAYQLQQNDLVYVGASTKKFKNLSGAEFRNNIMPLTQTISIVISFLNFFLLLSNK